MTNNICNKTNIRLNLDTLELKRITRPLNYENGFEWTEDFDGIQIINNKKLYYNFKFICDKGGAQTRSLRETYHFIKAQLEYLNTNKNSNIIFINLNLNFIFFY